MNAGPVAGVIFDKDGTLFDFSATWDVWAAGVLGELAAGDAALLFRLAEAARFDLARGGFHADSPVIAGTHRETAELLAGTLPGADLDALERDLAIRAAAAPLCPAVPLDRTLDRLRDRGLRLSVMTNDSEATARAHLRSARVLDRFDRVTGFDSGFGGKPGPEPLWACADAMGLAPAACVMVGDSTHDLRAGRAAGMRCVGVLTGPAGADDLAPLADAVLADIGHLEDWIAALD